MLRFAISVIVITLFITLFIAFRQLLQLWLVRHQQVSRLQYWQNQRLNHRFARFVSRNERLYRHLSELLESLQFNVQPGSVIITTVLMLLAGTSCGAMLFQSLKGTLLLGTVLGALPYMLLRMMLVHQQMKTRIDFLPAVELFYQCCLVSGGKQIRTALQRTVDEKRLLGPMQSVFEQLYRNVSVRGDDEASLRIFAASLGHVWADYFVNIVRAGLAEGHPIADNLKELITDMRKARRASQQERNKLLEIRLANFSPVLFLGLFVGINFHYTPENAYLYYIVDPKGRDLLLNAIVLIFVSFVMGLWLSRRKM
ncbi:type II secretion system F family protein [Paenibacillus sp. sptzw28]|uniref:type II secretion system F family protein n=1 Tax=Paenibacillus sp. sptzw28 TaxID=715179 RepID=UPI001C6F0789|nr:type II secretion system F family protein [Paenibacillus sp. sptzw28]QYR20737.1 type II secretion system F family protein [Paenibacillus sp. sptzw28]